jgi:hypothetical protein
MQKYMRSFVGGLCLTGLLGLPGASHAGFVIESLNGDITPSEVSNFIATINGLTPSTNNYGNAMSTHGTAVEGMRRMYEATGNVAILNRYIAFCDVYLVHRNDQPQGEHRAMWTGEVEPIWPQSSTTNQSGCESAHVAGHIADCARLILQTPSIWNNTVPDGNPYGHGATYKARALTYVAKSDETLARYFTKWFVNPTTFRIRKPTAAGWVNAAETAWNRQALTITAYQHLAEAHEILGDNPNLVSFYRKVVNAFATWFVAPFPSGGGVYYTSGGRNVVKYYYEIPSDTHIENIGHAQHDMMGLFQTYESGYTAVTSAQVKVYADSTQYVINKGATNAWAGNVDGTGGPTTSLKTDFIFLSQWNRSLFKMIAQSNIDANQVGTSSEACKNVGFILYMKHWLFTHPVGGTPTPTATATSTPTASATPTSTPTPTPTATATPTVRPSLGGYYKMIARHCGKAVVVKSASTSDGADVIQWTYGGANTNDEWLFTSIGSGYYKITARHSGKALMVEGASTANAANVIQWTYGGAATNDEWQPVDLGNGYHRIVNRSSGKVLNVSGASTSDGANVDQWSWANVNQQMFQLTSIP